MPIELSILPPMVVEQIMSVKNGNPVQFTNNGEVVLTLTEEIKQPSYAKGDFDYDLERMKKAVEAPSIRVPKFDTPEALLEWMESLTDTDFEMGRV